MADPTGTDVEKWAGLDGAQPDWLDVLTSNVQLGRRQAVGDHRSNLVGAPDSAATLTVSGYAYNDLNGDGVYSPGEGRAGIAVFAGNAHTITAADGSYSLTLVPEGYGTAVFFGDPDGDRLPDSPSIQIAAVAGQDVIVNWVGRTIETSANVQVSYARNLTGLGNVGLTLPGNDFDNIITGTSGADTISGGNGIDVARIFGVSAAYTLSSLAPGQYSVTHAGVTDMLAGIERVQFDDVTVDLRNYDQQYHFLTGLSGSGNGEQGFYIGDFTGDGFDDTLVVIGGLSGARVSGQGFQEATSWTGAGNNGHWYVGDFNGDGKDDIFRLNPGVSGAEVLLSTGSAFNAPLGWTPAGAGGQGWYVGDFTGDGRSDILRFVAGVSGAQVFTSNGSAFVGGDSWSGAGNGGKWYVGDFNGDGRDDLMRFIPGAAGAQVLLSNGTSFAAPQTWLSADSAGDDGWYVGDFDGDGKDDIMRYVPGYSGADVFISSGTGFVSAGSWTPMGHGPEPWQVTHFFDHAAAELMRYTPGVGADLFVI